MDCRRTRLLPEESNICKLRCRSLSTRVNVKLLTNRNAVVKEATLLIQSRVWNKILRLQEQMAVAPMMTVLHLIEQEAPDAGQTHADADAGGGAQFYASPIDKLTICNALQNQSILCSDVDHWNSVIDRKYGNHLRKQRNKGGSST